MIYNALCDFNKCLLPLLSRKPPPPDGDGGQMTQ